jgi:hypothetical protein
MSAQIFYHSSCLNRELLLRCFSTWLGFKVFRVALELGLAKKWIVRAFESDRRGVAVAGIDDHVVRKDEQFVSNGL